MKTITLESKKLNQATQKAQPKVKPTVYLKLKYLTATNKVLIKQNHEWVEKNEHKYLKFLPVNPVKAENR